MKLSKRLSSIAAYVTPGLRLADIGTDHGYIPIKLVAEGIIPSALAMDIRSGPLSIAKTHIEEAGLSDKIITRLSDGVDALKADEADSILIAGMGGELIIDILKRSDHIKDSTKEYILSPHTEWKEVRAYLHEHGYEIVKEDMLIEDNKYYLILKAVYNAANSESSREYKDIYAAFGELLIKRNDSILMQFLNKEEKLYENILRGLDTKETRDKTGDRIQEITDYLRNIKEAKDEMQRAAE